MSQCKCIAGLLLKPALLPVWRSAFSENLLPPNRLRTLIHPIPFSQLRKTKITKNNPSGKPGSLHNYIRRRSAQEKQLAVFGQRPHLVVDDLLPYVEVRHEGIMMKSFQPLIYAVDARFLTDFLCSCFGNIRGVYTVVPTI